MGFTEGFVLKDCLLGPFFYSPSHKEQQKPLPKDQVSDHLYGLVLRQVWNFELLSRATLPYPLFRHHVNLESDAESHNQICDSLH